MSLSLKVAGNVEGEMAFLLQLRPLGLDFLNGFKNCFHPAGAITEGDRKDVWCRVHAGAPGNFAA